MMNMGRSLGRTVGMGISQVARNMTSEAKVSPESSTGKVKQMLIRGLKVGGFHTVVAGIGLVVFNEQARNALKQIGSQFSKLADEVVGDVTKTVEDLSQIAKVSGGGEVAQESHTEPLTESPAEQTAEDVTKVFGDNFKDDKSDVKFLREALTVPVQRMQELHQDLSGKIKEIESLCKDLSKNISEVHVKIDEAMKVRKELVGIHHEIGLRLNNQEAGLDRTDLSNEKDSHMSVEKFFIDIPADVESYKKKVDIERAVFGFDKVFDNAEKEGSEWDKIVKDMGGSAPDLSAKIGKLKESLNDLVKTKQLMDKSYKDVQGRCSGPTTSDLINKLKERIRNYEIAIKNDETFASLEQKSGKLKDSYEKWECSVAKDGDMGNGQCLLAKEMKKEALEVLKVATAVEEANDKRDRKDAAAESRVLGNLVLRHLALMNPEGVGYTHTPLPEKRTWSAFIFDTAVKGAALGGVGIGLAVLGGFAKISKP